jgi:hypothetical protein
MRCRAGDYTNPYVLSATVVAVADSALHAATHAVTPDGTPDYKNVGMSTAGSPRT